MKKTYIIPTEKIMLVEAEALIAGSLQKSPKSAGSNDGDVNEDETGGGDGLAKGESFWGSGW